MKAIQSIVLMVLHAPLALAFAGKTPLLDRGAPYRQLATQMVDHHFAVGIVGSVLEDDEYHDFSAGYADRLRDVPVDSETFFALGSASKVVTATLLAREVVLGNLDLEHTVGSILEELEATEVGAIQLWELAAHVSGLERNPSDYNGLDEKDPYRDYNPDLLIDYLKKVRVGEKKYLYSNVGYGLLTQILERVTGLSYADQVRAHISVPLNEPDIRVGWDSIRAGKASKKYSAILKEVPVWSTLNAFSGSGDVKITLNAMRTWMYYQVHPDHAPFPLDEAIQLTQVPRYTDPEGFDIGLAWFHDPINGTRYITHNGSTEGFTVELLFHPEDKRAFVFVSNTDTYYPGLCLTDIFTGIGCELVPTELPPETPRFFGTYEVQDGDKLETNSWMKIYPSPTGSFVVVEVEDAPPYRLLYDADQKTYYSENDRFVLKFRKGGGGILTESTREGDSEYTFFRVGDITNDLVWLQG